MDVHNADHSLPHDKDLDLKVKKCMERISENIHISANEPSLAVYRLQEHVRRALPPTVSRRQHVIHLHSQLQGACYDVEYALGAVQGIKESKNKLVSIQDMLKDSIFYRKQLNYEQSRRKGESSMYKRISSHLTSIDLPDFPDALRETASRVESALHQARAKRDKLREEDMEVPSTNQKSAIDGDVLSKSAPSKWECEETAERDNGD